MVYIPGKFLGGTDALSRYGVRDNNDESVNWMSEISKNMAEVDSIAPWSDDTLCYMTGSQPPVTELHREGGSTQPYLAARPMLPQLRYPRDTDI